mmetsp:Transcript_23096/g.58905  ORF Transcript_23096/g.58905 Transcript_23096/m.58905 type:complete len:204 (-) Transcript_23096:478-1089(-)
MAHDEEHDLSKERRDHQPDPAAARLRPTVGVRLGCAWRHRRQILDQSSEVSHIALSEAGGALRLKGRSENMRGIIACIRPQRAALLHTNRRRLRRGQLHGLERDPQVADHWFTRLVPKVRADVAWDVDSAGCIGKIDDARTLSGKGRRQRCRRVHEGGRPPICTLKHPRGQAESAEACVSPFHRGGVDIDAARWVGVPLCEMK